MIGVPLVIVFAPGTSLYREQDLISHLPIVRNGPAGTFVVFPSGVRVSLPTDQVVSADERDGAARVGFGGMRFTGLRRPSAFRAGARPVARGAAVSSAEPCHDAGSKYGVVDSGR